MASSEYHHRQAQIAARLALCEPDRTKAARLNLLSLEHLEKAAKAKSSKPSHRRSYWPSGKEDRA